MTNEFSQDKPVNREAVVAGYTPEMVEARDELANRLTALKESAKAADVTDTLPPRLGVHTYENGATVLEIGHLSEDFYEASEQYRTDKALGAIAVEIDGTSMPGSELMMVTFNDRVSQEPEDPYFPSIEQPTIKMEWGNADSAKQKDGETIRNSLSFYADGYVETSTEVIRIEYTHPPDASDLVKTYGAPKVHQEVSVMPPHTRPAELADVQNAGVQLQGSLTRYGLNE